MSASRTKQFHLGDILSITTGVLVSPRTPPMDGIYDICNYMTGDSLFTHQLIRAANECKPALLKQFPQLANIEVPKLTPETYRAWLDEQVEKYGEFFEVQPLTKGKHEFKDAIEELQELMPNKPIIVAKV